MTDRIGQHLGNYQLIQLLGQGRWASVYLGEHQHLHTQAAIKVLYGPWTDREVEGFLDEARTLARLRHPHIVRLLDFGVQEGTSFLVMEYAPGGTLRQLHPKGTRLPLNTVVSYGQTRFRAGAEPSLALLAAVGIVAIGRWWSGRSRPRVAAPVVTP